MTRMILTRQHGVSEKHELFLGVGVLKVFAGKRGVPAVEDFVFPLRKMICRPVLKQLLIRIGEPQKNISRIDRPRADEGIQIKNPPLTFERRVF